MAINDLWAVVNENVYENVCDDTIHLSPIGIERCAASTAEAIRRAAEERKAE